MKQQRKIILFTKEGYEKKQSELKNLQERRISAVNELQVARDQGDRSENGAYKAARWRLSGIDRQIRTLNRILLGAKVVKKPTDSKIGLGSSIEVLWNNTPRSFTIVGQEESDLQEGKISVSSPIGKALLGKAAGDDVEINAPGGKQSIRIASVS